MCSFHSSTMVRGPVKVPTLESAYKAGNFEKNPFVLGTLIIALLLSTSLRTLNENCKINNKVVSGVYILPQTLLLKVIC